MPSINQIADWQDSLQQGLETVYGTVATTLNTMGIIGQAEVEYMPEFIDSGESAGGTSERLLEEYAVGKKGAAVSYKTRADERRVYMGLRSLFQSSGTKVAGPPFKFTFNPWTAQPVTNIGNSIVVVGLESLANAGLQMLGTICESVKLESSEGGFVTLTKKYRGLTSTLVTPAAAAGVWRGTLQHMHYLNALKINGGANITPAKMSIEFMNNLHPYYGTSQTPTDLALGNFAAKGSYTVPYKAGMTQQAFALNRTSTRIAHDFWTSGLNGGIVADFDIVYEDAKITEENGLKMIEFPWNAAKGSNTTKVEIWSTIDLSLT